MALEWNEAYDAIKDAEKTIREMELRVHQMAGLVAGRLRTGNVGFSILCKLKRELKRYNMHTGIWK